MERVSHEPSAPLQLSFSVHVCHPLNPKISLSLHIDICLSLLLNLGPLHVAVFLPGEYVWGVRVRQVQSQWETESKRKKGQTVDRSPSVTHLCFTNYPPSQCKTQSGLDYTTLTRILNMYPGNYRRPIFWDYLHQPISVLSKLCSSFTFIVCFSLVTCFHCSSFPTVIRCHWHSLMSTCLYLVHHLVYSSSSISFLSVSGIACDIAMWLVLALSK